MELSENCSSAMLPGSVQKESLLTVWGEDLCQEIFLCSSQSLLALYARKAGLEQPLEPLLAQKELADALLMAEHMGASCIGYILACDSLVSPEIQSHPETFFMPTSGIMKNLIQQKVVA